jgi:DnaK suppressor protein
MGKSGKKLNKKDLKEFKGLLLKHMAFIEGDVAMMEADIKSNRASSGSFSKIPTHPSDIGGDNFEQDFTYERIEAEGFELRDIKKALDKIEDKSFGICEMCEIYIPKRRLRAIPYCKHCIECQEISESQK